MNLTEAREALAVAVSTLDGVTCLDHPVPGNLRAGDAFVTAGRRTYGADLRSHEQQLSAYVVLGTDERAADLQVDALAGPLLECIADLYAANVSVEPQQLITTGAVPGTVFALALSLSLELSA